MYKRQVDGGADGTEGVSAGDGAVPEGADARSVVDAGAKRRDLEPALAYALRHVGDPYRLGGRGPGRWDCSGLVQEAYRRAGVRLPRLAADQYRATRRVPRDALRRGDLLFWSANGRASGVHHVAIYLGGGRYVEAARPGTKVRVSSLSSYKAQLYGRVARPGSSGRGLYGEGDVTCSGEGEGCG